MKRHILNFNFLLVATFTLFLLTFAYGKGQSIDDLSIPSQIPGLEEQITINVYPENPAPNQPVNISLEAYGTDLSRAQISWLSNGSVVQSGTGITTYDFTAGKTGSVKTITIMILPINGSKITREVVIAPASVDIVWESPGSYTPPFYKGKALYPAEGFLTFVALPNLIRNGSPIDSKSLIYKWTLNDEVFADRSGYGKNTFSYQGDVLDKPVTIEVEASSIDKSVVGVGSITVSSITPQVHLYEKNPLYGELFNRSLGNDYSLKANELTVSAFPYYFLTPSFSSAAINYDWSINGSPIPLAPHQNNVTFRNQDETAGQSIVLVEAKHRDSFLQTAENRVLIDFNPKNNATVSF